MGRSPGPTRSRNSTHDNPQARAGAGAGTGTGSRAVHPGRSTRGGPIPGRGRSAGDGRVQGRRANPDH